MFNYSIVYVQTSSNIGPNFMSPKSHFMLGFVGFGFRSKEIGLQCKPFAIQMVPFSSTLDPLYVNTLNSQTLEHHF
jgi:hypothetical protein